MLVKLTGFVNPPSLGRFRFLGLTHAEGMDVRPLDGFLQFVKGGVLSDLDKQRLQNWGHCGSSCLKF